MGLRGILSAIATVLEDHGLKPIDSPTIQGFDSVDQFLEALPKDTPPTSDFDAQWNAFRAISLGPFPGHVDHQMTFFKELGHLLE